MARVRKEPNRYWSKEDKLKIINEVLYGKTSYEVARKYDVSSGMIRNWIIKYREFGEDALVNKKKPGEESIKFNNLINGNGNVNHREALNKMLKSK